ncbi:hypothetical protein LCM27_03375 [Ruegeria marisrubri]|uniref:hypothetical protein n=1 Tax=Ruegeria marisrubri TaxID=1685379 RepID=UPI001CD2EDB4|nr:hypothetical protein [Ruegeria marisrubri]MCA0905432.1 hypothetical protein [Ruegeria marisrubri]
MTTKYIVPAPLVEKIETLGLGYPALKLVHGLLLSAHLEVGGNTSLLWRPMSRRSVVRTAFLRAEIGAAREKGNRQIRAALEDPQLKSVFEEIHLLENGRGIVSMFRKDICEVATVRNFDPATNEKHQYALLESANLAACRTATDILLLTRVCMHRRQKYPAFHLFGFQQPEVSPANNRAMNKLAEAQAKLQESVRKAEADPVAWPDVRDKWLGSACRVAKLTGDRFVFVLEEGVSQLGVRRVKVRISNAEAKWKPEVLHRCPAGSRLVEIDSDGHRYLTAERARLRARTSLENGERA